VFNLPDKYGHFDKYGGRFIPERLISLFQEVETQYYQIRQDEKFILEYNQLLKSYSGRPTPLYFAKRMSEKAGGAKIYLKREDLNHSSSVKINSSMGQILTALKMSKKEIVTETASGMGGVAVASIAATKGLECKVFMGAKDIAQQPLNVLKITRLGATLIPVSSGQGEGRDALNQLFQYLLENNQDTFWVSNSAYGPHPYPEMVRDFQSVIGYEIYKQLIDLEHKEPDYLVAPLAVGATALGAFNSFLQKDKVNLVAVEAAGKGLVDQGFAGVADDGKDAVLHGSMTRAAIDGLGNAKYLDTISTEMRYPAVGPEVAWLKDKNKVQFAAVTNEDAINAYQKLAVWEGIIASIEAAHAVGHVLKIAPTLDKEQIIVAVISAGGDKDIQYVLNYDNSMKERK